MKRFLAVLTLLAAPALWAADGLPGGKWWQNPQVIERLSITEEQQNRLDAVFRTSASDLIDLRAEAEKRGIELRGQLDQRELSREAIQRTAGRLSEARSRLFERELMMLIDMRGVLTGEQWNRFRSALSSQERPRGERPREPRRMRPPGRIPRR